MATLRMGVFALFLSFFVALAGCGAPAVKYADIPLPPDVMPLEAGSNTFADSFADTLRASLSERGTVDIKLYSVGPTVDWATVDGFYTDALADTDWTSATELRQESSVINTAGWTRGGLATEQGLVVGYAPGLLGDDAFLIVALVSE